MTRSAVEEVRPPAHSRRNAIIGVVVTIAVLVLVFAFAIPQFANYGAVTAKLESLSAVEITLITAATLLTVVTFWWINMAALPGLRFWQSAAVTQTGYAVSNTIPAGGPISIGLNYQMLRSFGFRSDDVVLMMGVSGIWNFLGKLIVPVLAIVFLLVSDERTPGMLAASLTALGAAAVAGLALFLILWRESLARRVGDALGRAASWFLHWFHHDPVKGAGDEAVSFRQRTVGVIHSRWIVLSIAAVVNQLAFFVVLVIALRALGVSERELSLPQAFSAFAFARLAAAVPITPGAVGTAELAFTGLLVAAGGPRPDVVAAVLVFRAFTYLLPIPIGAVSYAIWRRWSKRHPQPAARTA